ncbi:MAG: hypothetical protein ACOZQL_21685 [Myxococcota bacterium]
MRTLVVVAVVVLSSCASLFPTVVPEAQNTEFKATGEVQLYNRSVSFDDVRVRSPHVNLAKRTDGSWGGTFAQRALDVTVTDKKISGVDFVLTREMSEGNKLVITGQFQSRIYRFELDHEQAMIRGPAQSMNFPGRQVGDKVTTYGPMGNFMLRGVAGSDDPPWPQIGFALVGMMQ